MRTVLSKRKREAGYPRGARGQELERCQADTASLASSYPGHREFNRAVSSFSDSAGFRWPAGSQDRKTQMVTADRKP